MMVINGDVFSIGAVEICVVTTVLHPLAGGKEATVPPSCDLPAIFSAYQSSTVSTMADRSTMVVE